LLASANVASKLACSARTRTKLCSSTSNLQAASNHTPTVNQQHCQRGFYAFNKRTTAVLVV
jgi:hypothetical protein